jgi:hypothetical protein
MGVGEKRAAAFERVLDDRPICGITGAGLGFLLRRYVNAIENREAENREAARCLAQEEIGKFLPGIEQRERYAMDPYDTPRSGRRR